MHAQQRGLPHTKPPCQLLLLHAQTWSRGATCGRPSGHDEPGGERKGAVDGNGDTHLGVAREVGAEELQAHVEQAAHAAGGEDVGAVQVEEDGADDQHLGAVVLPARRHLRAQPGQPATTSVPLASAWYACKGHASTPPPEIPAGTGV